MFAGEVFNNAGGRFTVNFLLHKPCSTGVRSSWPWNFCIPADPYFGVAVLFRTVRRLSLTNTARRNLSLSSVLIGEDGHIQLAISGNMFCKAGMEREVTTSTFCGEPSFMAPEVCLLSISRCPQTTEWSSSRFCSSNVTAGLWTGGHSEY